ncbi:MAG: hypothetical protein AB1555_06875 [Nitrospirota bacterium]
MKRRTLNGSELRLGRLFAVLRFGQPLGSARELIVGVEWTSGPVPRPVFRARRTKELDSKKNRQYDKKELTVPTYHYVIPLATAA